MRRRLSRCKKGNMIANIPSIVAAEAKLFHVKQIVWDGDCCTDYRVVRREDMIANTPSIAAAEEKLFHVKRFEVDWERIFQKKHLIIPRKKEKYYFETHLRCFVRNHLVFKQKRYWKDIKTPVLQVKHRKTGESGGRKSGIQGSQRIRRPEKRNAGKSGY